MTRRRRESGVAMVEFALAGIASIFLLICTFHLSMGMWNYHSIANAAHETSRYVAVKGVNCRKPGQTCYATVANIATKFKYFAIGIPDDQVNVTLTTHSGTVTTCAPLNTCLTDTTIWPPTTNNDNYIGKNVTVEASYGFRSPLLFFWPGKGSVNFGQVWFPASSTNTIVY
jgi:Flp pilus assembly protein TadG